MGQNRVREYQFYNRAFYGNYKKRGPYAPITLATGAILWNGVALSWNGAQLTWN